MKKVLITGANSYVGTNVERWLMQEPDKYQVDTLDMIDGSWREKDFSGYDVVFHVAGIAHVKETRRNRDLFFKANRDLAIEVAEVSKKAGVSQFIFLSSMSVYGLDTGIITRETVPKPKSSYGKSKFQAEEEIRKLEGDYFKVAILRPPMIYGKGCKGNFPKLVKLVKILPVFPKVNNQRSMIYIENFSNFVKRIIDNDQTGLFFPQNREYLNTTELARWISERFEKNIHISSVFGIVISLLSFLTKKTQKAFGKLVYEYTDDFDFDYCVIDEKESVKRSITE